MWFIQQYAVLAYIKTRTPFQVGRLSGISGAVYAHYTMLNGADSVIYDLQWDDITFTVRSYYTPIAWYVAGDVNEWVIPDAHYTMITARHQRIVRTALAGVSNVYTHES